MDQQFSDIFTIVLAVLAVMAWKFAPRLIAGVPFLDAGDIKRRLDLGDIEVVIDLRGQHEYLIKDGHIPGAINVPLAELSARVKQLAADLEPYKELPVILAGAGEQPAAHAARALRRAGFRNIAVLKGGMRAWKRAGLPLEKGLPDANGEPAPGPETAAAAEPAAEAETAVAGEPAAETPPQPAERAEPAPSPEPAPEDAASEPNPDRR